MGAKITIKAGERVRILRRFSSSLPGKFRFSARALDGSEPVGEVEVQGSAWLFAKPASTRPLSAENTASKGMWDTFYSIYVTPAQDIEIDLKARRGGVSPVLVAAVLVALAVGSALFFRVA